MLSQKFVACSGEDMVVARWADQGIPRVFRGGPTPSAPPSPGERINKLLTQDTEPDEQEPFTGMAMEDTEDGC